MIPIRSSQTRPTLRTLLLDRFILVDALAPVTGISRNKAVARRALVCLVGVLAHTRGDLLWANWHALVVVADIVKGTVDNDITDGQQESRVALNTTYHS